MTDNEIVKALECCADEHEDCKNCPVYDFCKEHSHEMVKATFDLINRQKAEIEALIAGQETLQKYIAEQKAEIENYSHNNRTMTKDIRELQKALERAKAEIERLQKKKKKKAFILAENRKNEIKAEAIKEFAERLKKRIAWRYTALFCERLNEIMDDIVEEMVGEGDGPLPKEKRSERDAEE